MSSDSPFHEGERAVQRRLGVEAEIEPWARKVVRPFLPDEHREFYAALPFLVAAARDGGGRPWATLLTGAPGFAHSASPGRLTIGARPVPGDALEGGFAAGSEVGLLGIELATRRRNRVNGRVAQAGPEGAIELEVDQAFGNCPQYIHERAWRRVDPPVRAPRPARHRTFTPELRELIERADTFFIATGHHGNGDHASFGMDASHRGGEPGFVKLEGARRLVFPDYAGNNHFNTIGNLVMDPRVGLLFVDFARGSLFQLTGQARVEWDPALVDRTPGAQRLVVFDLDEAVVLDDALPIRWDIETPGLRPLRLVRVTEESADVRSFHFEPLDGSPLPPFVAGQHLPIEFEHPDGAGRVRRTYSLSNAPGEPGYRISVKREPKGVASRVLHDRLQEGDVLQARMPAGEFVIAPGTRPVVLASAGIGVTPLLSMLHQLSADGDPRRIHFLHVARDADHHPHAAEARELAEASPGISVHVSYTRPGEPPSSFDAVGRLDAARVANLVPGLDADFYLCGPTPFMAELHAGLEAHGVPADQIHAESFGPAAQG